MGGETYWLVPSARSQRKRTPAAHLLPNYDEYFIGFKNRCAIGKRLSSTANVTIRDALTPHVIVVDGQLVGGWKRTLAKTAVVVEVRFLVGLSGSEKNAVREAAHAFGDFLELPVELRGGAYGCIVLDVMRYYLSSCPDSAASCHSSFSSAPPASWRVAPLRHRSRRSRRRPESRRPRVSRSPCSREDASGVWTPCSST